VRNSLCQGEPDLFLIERFLAGCTKEHELIPKKDISGGHSGDIIPDL